MTPDYLLTRRASSFSRYRRPNREWKSFQLAGPAAPATLALDLLLPLQLFLRWAEHRPQQVVRSPIPAPRLALLQIQAHFLAAQPAATPAAPLSEQAARPPLLAHPGVCHSAL